MTFSPKSNSFRLQAKKKKKKSSFKNRHTKDFSPPWFLNLIPELLYDYYLKFLSNFIAHSLHY